MYRYFRIVLHSLVNISYGQISMEGNKILDYVRINKISGMSEKTLHQTAKFYITANFSSQCIKLTAFTGRKSKVAQMIVPFLVSWVENILRKGENAGYWHFLPFSHCFQQTAQSSRSRKIMRESHINEIKHIQNHKPLREFTHKNHRKKL